MDDAPYDPRAVANLMLDEADRNGICLTNLALQKLLYFAHGIFLNETKRPLVKGYFEAWQYGPVHPLAYKAFRSSGGEPIRERAEGQNALTGQRGQLHQLTDPSIRRLVQQVLDSYGRLPAGRLVDLSHAKNSPWQHIVDKGRTSVALGSDPGCCDP